MLSFPPCPVASQWFRLCAPRPAYFYFFASNGLINPLLRRLSAVEVTFFVLFNTTKKSCRGHLVASPPWCRSGSKLTYSLHKATALQAVSPMSSVKGCHWSRPWVSHFTPKQLIEGLLPATKYLSPEGSVVALPTSLNWNHTFQIRRYRKVLGGSELWLPQDNFL